MTSKASTVGGIFFLFTFIFIIVLAYWDYYTTPQAKLLPGLSALLVVLYGFLSRYGEYLGIAVPGLAKKNFITRGGLIGCYEKHEEHQGGMVTYYFTVYSRYLRHCNYYDFAEVGAFQRFMLMLTPSRMVKLTGLKSNFEEVPHAGSDTPEGAIFYHGTLRGASIASFEESLRIKLDKANKVISELWTIMETAKAGLEASSQGQNRQLQDAATTLSSAMENLDKYRKENAPVMMVDSGMRR